MDNDLTDEDKNKLMIGKEAWDESMLYFHNPAIPDPHFAFDKSKLLGFFIQMGTWQVVMNLENCPHSLLDSEKFTYFHSLALHEISHYVICPYDTITQGKLLVAAMKHVLDHQAPVVVNLFSDLVVDTKLHQKKPDIMEFELKETMKMNNDIGMAKDSNNHSDFYKILLKCYEIMWNLNLKLPKSEYEEIKTIAEKISEIILKDFEDTSTWESKVSKIASLLSSIVQKEFPADRSNFNSKCNNNPSAGDLGTDEIEPRVPQDVQGMMGNPLEVKSKAKKNNKNEGHEDSENEKDAETLAQELSLDEFVRLNRIMELVDQKDAIRVYYRGMSKNLINIKITQKKPTGTIPVGIEPWKIGDPIEKLDVVQSALISPKLIPNITTRKWIYQDGPGVEYELQLPDLMIVVDSSGSMQWDFTAKKNNKSPFHVALVASFAALQFAISKGVKVSAINFSDYFVSQSWTTEYEKIENILLHYMGMGTTLPVKKIKDFCYESDRKSLIILITDFEIHNWNSAYNDIVEILTMGNKLIGFFIGGKQSEIESGSFDDLTQLGAKFYTISKINDLIGLVIKEVQETYT